MRKPVPLIRSLTLLSVAGYLLSSFDPAAAARSFAESPAPLVTDDDQWSDAFAWPQLDGPIWSLTVHDGALVAGGLFTQSQTHTLNHVARLDGPVWHGLGTGFNDSVKVVITWNGDLVAGGSFTTAGGIPARSIARWDGTQWHPLGSGLNGSVSAIVEFDGDLIAGGASRTSRIVLAR